ncbi:hypothetical protein BAUCODRAFT_61973 [Baudoinia panamericana UAMH 10762]|uniref:RAVE complex protein Rav1 C-terminal domain-containing protein n=1 Tax=Baudoinia panamericana (strain UAMH 10762) TaxID=717646 RepID=M2N9L5_BAUPA|nr:uncharacterized protein BAUCODRAFT_61973 [Baudoinia panamericana UAMH 10762]EMD00889.1 hypothetical protein BAUCODRAFT_61973 [Baudoinia panamericana UAMH 10762]
MPSTSPGRTPTADFIQILPGAPTASLQATTTFVFRHKRYIVYISGRQLNVLSSPTNLVQAFTFNNELIAVTAESQTGKLVVAESNDVYTLEPHTEGWTRVWWEKSLRLQLEQPEDEARCLSWGGEGEILIGGSICVSLFSTLPSSRTSSPAASPIDGEVMEDRRPLWSKAVASPLQYASFSPTADLIASCGRYDRLVKIWRRLSYEEGLFDYVYLPHGGAVTHLEWRPLDQHAEQRRGSGISGRHEEDPEVLYTIANDGLLRIWRTGGVHDIDVMQLHATIDLVSAIPQSPTLSAKNGESTEAPTRYAVILPSESFCAAVSGTGIGQSTTKISHSMEHLKETTSKSPDVVIALDGHGRMSAWGVQSVGHKRRPETPTSTHPFHIAHAEAVPISLPEYANARFQAWFDGRIFHLLAHTFDSSDGHIAWWQGDIETFFSPSARGPDRLLRLADWSGHSDNVLGLRPSADNQRLLSWSSGSNGQHHRVWKYLHPSPSLVILSARAAMYYTLLLRMVASSTAERTDTFHTDVGHCSILAVNAEVAALVSGDRKEIIIVDLSLGFVEHKQAFEGRIERVKCYATGPGHNMIALGYGATVVVLAQGRYEHHREYDVWTVVKTISVSSLGLPISDMSWLVEGCGAVAIGNGIILVGNTTEASSLDTELREQLDIDHEKHHQVSLPKLAARLKQPTPVWHPSLLSHLLRHGKLTTAISIFRRLGERLRFWSEGEPLHPLLDATTDTFLDELGHTAHSDLDSEAVQDLMEQLGQKDLPAVSDAEQRRLKRILQALTFIFEHVKGLDTWALRYLFEWKLSLLQADEEQGEPNGVLPNGAPHKELVVVPDMHWREIAFASHSGTQQPLLDILTLHYDNKLTWPIARSLGIMAWLTDKEALAQVFESLAQSAYRQTSPPDPTNASLYFLALHKKPTLLALWRIATWHKEQRATMNFLKRDFGEASARTAAKKNAYALMGKRRFEYAAAFFLLADDAASATGLLAGQCEDIMLAIAVARLYSGDGSATLGKLLTERLVPEAHKHGNRWLMSWYHHMLAQKQEAADALVVPLSGVRTWHQDDSATLMLYKKLRHGASEHEYQAVLRAARVLRRMGLWLLALELVSRWEFKHPAAPGPAPQALSNGTSTTNGAPAAPSMLDDSEPPAAKDPPPVSNGHEAPSATVADDQASRAAKAAELLKKLKSKQVEQPVLDEKKPPPTQFKEPDASSLLDSFGF